MDLAVWFADYRDIIIGCAAFLAFCLGCLAGK